MIRYKVQAVSNLSSTGRELPEEHVEDTATVNSVEEAAEAILRMGQAGWRQITMEYFVVDVAGFGKYEAPLNKKI